MAHQVVWLGAAADDLDEIAAYIAADSSRYAGIVTEKILAAARELADFPNMGAIVSEWNDESYRQRIVYSYRLIYRIKQDQVEVLTVIHGARLLPSSIRNRDR
jgi:addiction module RelE/StbE family toxin